MGNFQPLRRQFPPYKTTFMENGNATLSATLDLPDVSAVRRFAGWLASKIKKGDWILLSGDLGTGKTELARGIIRHIFGEDMEVPSPTFTLVQHYESPEMTCLHADLYRIESPEEISELGLLEENESLVLVEWPDRLGGFTPENHVRIELEDKGGPRRCALSVGPPQAAFLDGIGDFIHREAVLAAFLEQHGHGRAQRVFMAGDASTRRYERIETAQGPLILMDWPPRPIAQDSHKARARLSGSVGDFRAVAAYLRRCGLSAPEVFAEDGENGLLLLEDFGPRALTHFLDEADPACPVFYFEAVLALAKLYHAADADPPEGAGRVFDRPVSFDLAVMLAELQRFIDWHAPSHAPLSDAALADWKEVWGQLAARLEAMRMRNVMMLRDVHSPNLHWLATRQGIGRVGFIDIQDAIAGHPAYDVVSLLQDARRDLPPDYEARFKALYVAETGLDGGDFEAAYHILGAQRNLRILGTFARLAEKQGKTAYLRHVPRVSGYVREGLKHAALSGLAAWFETHLPEFFET